ncbi:histidine kinase famiy protein [Aquabacterium sp. J223]|uniref:histidine kinase famiy protein n=1 Tax=Aquabacterium sp. J223 TaxID=2898431 RepID=UPI0021AD96C6|nr:histidine kinase famiy protein [Aquabacterium sp. J223]UUX94407.1 PAS domain-containing protein [Aquabacterium sp. J223]
MPAGPSEPVTVSHEKLNADRHGRDIFFAAVETTRMPMVITDPRQPDNPIVFANHAFLQMTGYEPEEVLGRNCRFLQGPETDRAAVAEVRQAISHGREHAVEILNYRKDGSSFWNALFVTPLYDNEGGLIYFFSSQLDVSRRRDAETALSQAQKMEALGQLTGGIAHDFNNLLQVIAGNVDVLERRMRKLGLDDEVLTKALTGARQGTNKSAALTQQLLSFARKQQLSGRVINLNELAQNTAELARRTLGGSVELVLPLADGLWNCRIDPTQAEVALLNLLLNSRDAMPQGGRITLRTENLLIDDAGAALRTLPAPGPYVGISVSDTGQGIPPEAQARVLDPFFTTKPAGSGTGLGLSMVYGFVKQSGGALTLYSEVGVGTTVTLYFPATEDAAWRPVPPSRSVQAGDERVLVVDDRPEIAEMAAMMLREVGYTVVECHSAKDALRLLDGEDGFDLLLTDLIMPGGMNGVVLAREARQRHPKLKVLLMTGFADGLPDKWGGRNFELIFKPYSQGDLTSKVRRVLHGADGTS